LLIIYFVHEYTLSGKFPKRPYDNLCIATDGVHPMSQRGVQVADVAASTCVPFETRGARREMGARSKPGADRFHYALASAFKP
jgi:hypothetical protein